ncbi:MAG: hypothetical protein DI636_12415, partial [Pelagerythrobacter marensis]
MGQIRALEEALDPILQFFRQTSALALYPVFILLLGLGETSKIFVIFWATLFPLLLATIGGVKEVDRKLIEMAATFGASRLTTFRRVVLPAAVPAIFVGLRLSATTALLLLIAAEMIGANKGLGFQVMNAQYNFQIPQMFAAILLTLRILAASTALALTLSPAWADVNLRYLSSQGGLSAFELADEFGYFDGTGITFENVGYAQGGPASLVALAGGSVEIGSAATAAVLNSIAAGNDFVAAYPSNGINDDAQSVFYVRDDSPIKSVTDIVGKTIAVNTLGAHLDYVVREALHQKGLPED